MDTKVPCHYKLLHRYMECVLLPVVDPGGVSREMVLHYELLVTWDGRDLFVVYHPKSRDEG